MAYGRLARAVARRYFGANGYYLLVLFNGQTLRGLMNRIEIGEMYDYPLSVVHLFYDGHNGDNSPKPVDYM